MYTLELFTRVRSPYIWQTRKRANAPDIVNRQLSAASERTQGFQSGPVPGTFTRLRSCIVPAEITEPPQNYRWSKPQVRWSIGLWNIFHKNL
jgi:hypothetical protein